MSGRSRRFRWKIPETGSSLYVSIYHCRSCLILVFGDRFFRLFHGRSGMNGPFVCVNFTKYGVFYGTILSPDERVFFFITKISCPLCPRSERAKFYRRRLIFVSFQWPTSMCYDTFYFLILNSVCCDIKLKRSRFIRKNFYLSTLACFSCGSYPRNLTVYFTAKTLEMFFWYYIVLRIYFYLHISSS